MLSTLELSAQAIDPSNTCYQFAEEGRAALAESDYSSAVQKYAYAAKLCPENANYQLELAQAWFFLKDFEKAIQICKPYATGKKAKPEAFRVLGNCLEGQGKNYEALETYRKGLKRFPNSGMLYAEMGILEFSRQRDSEALAYWEKGIISQPTFPSNYYYAAKQCLNIKDFAWTANYAEMYINLVRQGENVREMSKLLMQAYEEARYFDYQNAFRWRFSQNPDSSRMTVEDLKYHNLLNEAFESELPDTVAKLSIKSLSLGRQFACLWNLKQDPHSVAFPLLDWQLQLQQLGFWEAYNYWLLYDARSEEFMDWFKEFQPRYEAFENWFLMNTIYRHEKKPMVRPAALN